MIYVGQTICTQLFVRPRLQSMSRFLHEAGVNQRIFAKHKHRRNLEKARQDQLSIGTAVNSSMDVIVLLCQIYFALNGLAVGIYFIEIIWFKVERGSEYADLKVV